VKHFSKEEFRGWYDLLHPELKDKLDEFRERLGRPVSISPAEGSLGRHLGDSSKSYHNVDKYHGLLAVDVMPATDDMKRCFRLAKTVGFGGIGLYSHWKPRWGMHLDVRPKAQKARWYATVNCKTGEQEYTYL